MVDRPDVSPERTVQRVRRPTGLCWRFFWRAFVEKVPRGPLLTPIIVWTTHQQNIQKRQNVRRYSPFGFNTPRHSGRVLL